MRMLLGIVCGLSFLIGSSVSAQPGVDKKASELEKNLSAEQERLVDELVNLEAREDVHYVNPMNPVPPRLLAEIRRSAIKRIAAMPAEDAKVYWRDLPKDLKQRFRRLDLGHVMADERTAAAGLPAEAKADVAKLMSDQIDEVIAARRKVLAYGPPCRALVADQVSRLAHDSPKRLRHLGLLKELDAQDVRESLLRISESALQRAAELKKGRGKAAPNTAVLVSRRVCPNAHPSEDPYAALSYYNFLHHNRDYKAGVGLEFGNGEGNYLDVNFYGGQDNRISNLGAVDFAVVKKAPGPATTAKWSNGRDGARMTAVVGHVFLLHVLDVRDNVSFTVKFRVLDRSPEEWIIIEWEPIPQDN